MPELHLASVIEHQAPEEDQEIASPASVLLPEAVRQQFPAYDGEWRYGTFPSLHHLEADLQGEVPVESQVLHQEEKNRWGSLVVWHEFDEVEGLAPVPLTSNARRVIGQPESVVDVVVSELI